ncbi:MAG: hypothetical protein OCD76_23875, partial [Reichenbachiella sp.]
MNRPTKEILDLRVAIPTASTAHAGVVEAFQNETIRPVIKLQHDLLIDLVKKEKTFQFAIATSGDKGVYRNHTNIWLQKKSKVKNQLIGVVIGMMSTDEFVDYKLHHQEYNKRIIQIIV